MMLYFEVTPTLAVFLLPVFVLVAVLAALAVGVWLSALNAIYRDVRYTIPFLTQIWLFATPIAYPSSLVPEEWQWLYGLNPMVGVVEGFRWTLLGAPPPSLIALGMSLGMVLLLLIAGLYFF